MGDPKKILISGGTGLIGSTLANNLVENGYTVHILSRRTIEDTSHKKYFQWDIEKGIAEAEAFKGIDTFIHLAGESIGEGRWTPEKKKSIIDSRVNSAHLAYETFKKIGEFPRQVISASGVGYYGAHTSDHIFKESDNPAVQDFVSQVCQLWEANIDPFKVHSKVCIYRIGVVLSEKGGALPLMAKPIKLLVGAALGTGKQYMPWIHIDDLIGLFTWSTKQTVEGVYNTVADEQVNNKVFLKSVANVLGRPLWPINVPNWLMQVILGEQSCIVLQGSRASNQKIKELNYDFQYAKLTDALAQLL